MTKKKIVAAGLIVAFAILATSAMFANDLMGTSKASVPEVVETTEVLPVQEEVTIQTLEFSDDTGGTICQKPQSGNEYGGIGASESNPPNGTSIDGDLTKYYSRTTATGVCGTYWYIVGWWFNATEISKLPQETLMYGVSPYAITGGSNGNTNHGDAPVVPVPEVATVGLVALGILAFVVWRKVANK
jgi:hypothetical protein